MILSVQKQIRYLTLVFWQTNKNHVHPNDTKPLKDDLQINHAFRKTANMENLAECQKPYTQKVNGNFGLHKMPLLKNSFLEKIETWHVGLSCQYTHFMSFSNKSEHDTIADQATLTPDNLLTYY